MRYIRYIIMSFIIINFANADEQESIIDQSATDLTSMQISQYISVENTSNTVIRDEFGLLRNESLVITYKPEYVTNYYRHKICHGVYWFDCNYNLRGIQEQTGVDLKQTNSLFESSIDLIKGYKINYTTIGIDGKSHDVSGGILIPQSKKDLKGIVLFYHYTTLNNRNVPSSFDKDETRLTKQLAGAFASSGYVVVMPDYIGQGDDESSVHPYVIYPENNALSGIYMLRLVSQIESNLKFNMSNRKIPLFISGYSEGGAYALAATKLLENNKSYLDNYGLKLKLTVPISGAYNLSKAMYGFLTDNNITQKQVAPYFIENMLIGSYLRPAFAADVALAFAHYGLNDDNESAIFESNFAICDGCKYKSKNYTISSIFKDSSIPEFMKYKLLKTAADNTEYGKNDNYSINPLIKPDFLNGEFKKQLAKADIYNWKASTPVHFLSLENDSAVTRLNSETAYLAMAKQGSKSLNITLVPNQNFKSDGYIPFTDIDLDHGTAIPFMFLFARTYFESDIE